VRGVLPDSKEFSVIIDTREKQPWWHDDQETFYVKSQKLDTGDVTIEEISNILIIERKKSVNELYANFTSERKRFYNEVERMKKFPLRFIIVEANWSDVINPFSYRTEKSRRVQAAAIVRSTLFNLMVVHGIHIIFAGNRAKYIAKHLLHKIYEYYCKGKLDARASIKS
jgi:ERCC4-type nuclease